MMTDYGGVGRSRGRRVARCGLPGAALALVLTNPGLVSADADGRADWRMPPASTSVPTFPPTGDAAPRDNAAPVLGGLSAQALVVGRPWRLHLRARDPDPDGGIPRVRVRGLPAGGSLEEEGGGWYRLAWTPPPEAIGTTTLTVIAVDARDPRLASERAIRLEVRGAAVTTPLAPSPTVHPGAVAGFKPEPRPEPTPEPTPEFEPDREPEPPVAPTPLPPRLEPLAARIVSAGRTVSVRVGATLDPRDGRPPIMRIDRLPRYASFDPNPDGSRTFHWPTGDRDQGEHRFRITASHPDDAALVSRADLLLIVGDPTHASTAPLDEGGQRGDGAHPAVTSIANVGDGAVDGADADGAEAIADAGRGETVPPPIDPVAPTFPDGAADALDAYGDDEPFLPRAGADEAGYRMAFGEGGVDGEPVGRYDQVDGPSSFREPDDPYFASPEAGYFDPDDDLPPGPDGRPFEP